MSPEVLEQQIREQRWKYAKTYHKKASHEYIMREWNEELYEAIMKVLKEEGYDKKYYQVTFRYVNIGNYKYWHHGIVTLNREPINCYDEATTDELYKSGYSEGSY